MPRVAGLEPRVLIAGVSTRAFAESAARAGVRCVSVDAFGDLDQKSRVENVALLRDLGIPYSAGALCRVASGLDAESAAYVGNLENHPAAVRRLARGRALLGNDAPTLARARDLDELGRVVEKAGGRVPATFDSVRDLPSGPRYIRKPRRGGGGSGVADLVPGSRLRSREVAQERIAGDLGSMSFAADGRRAAILGFSRGLHGESGLGGTGYRYCGSLYPFRLQPQVADRLEAIAQAATSAFGLRGLNGIDFILAGGEAVVLELNPRYCASMELLERAHGQSLFQIHAAACRGELPPSLGKGAEGVLGKGILWARHDLRAGDTRPFLGREDVRDVPFPDETIRRGHPVCTVFASGADTEECHRRLLSKAAAVEQELQGQPREARA